MSRLFPLVLTSCCKSHRNAGFLCGLLSCCLVCCKQSPNILSIHIICQSSLAWYVCFRYILKVWYITHAIPWYCGLASIPRTIFPVQYRWYSVLLRQVSNNSMCFGSFWDGILGQNTFLTVNHLKENTDLQLINSIWSYTHTQSLQNHSASQVQHEYWLFHLDCKKCKLLRFIFIIEFLKLSYCCVFNGKSHQFYKL